MTTESTTNLVRMPLDRLKRLAKEGPDAATRAAAAKAIEARKSTAQSAELAVEIEIATTEYGTPQPQLLVIQRGRPGARELRAVLYELAGQAERTLSRTPELWLVSVRHDGDEAGAIVIELMDGDAAETERACALLRSLVRATGPKKRGRPKTRSAQSAVTTEPTATKKPDAKRANAATASA